MFKLHPVDMCLPDSVSGSEALDPITARVTSRIMAQIGETLPNYKKIHPLLNAFLIREIAVAMSVHFLMEFSPLCQFQWESRICKWTTNTNLHHLCS